jgi:hypothetical protein
MAAFGKAKNFRMTLRRFDDVTINKPSSVMDSEVVKPFLPAEPPPPPVKVEEAKPTPSKPKYNY